MEHLKIDPEAVSSQLSTDELQKQNSRKSLILRCQRILFSAYRTDQYADPDGFLTSLGAVLEQYPNEVVIYVTDPRTGVQRDSKFPPTISEIVEACDGRVADLQRHDRFRNWGKKDEPELLEAPREKRLTLEELKAKYGPNWGMKSLDEKPKGKTFKAPTKEELAAHYREYGLAFQPKQQTAAE